MLRHLTLIVVIGSGLTTACAQATRPFAHWQFSAQNLANSQFRDATGKHALTLHGELEFTQHGLVIDKQTQLVVNAKHPAAKLPSKELTLEAWVRIDETPKWAGLISAIEDNGEVESGWMLGTKGGRFVFALATTDTGRLEYLESIMPIRHGNWYHVVGTYNGATQRLYVDGEIASEATHSGKIHYADHHALVVGAYQDKNERHPTVGVLHAARIYSHGLNARLVNKHYRKQQGFFAGAALTEEIADVHDWPGYMRDGARRGVSAEVLKLPLHNTWTFTPKVRPSPAWPDPAKVSHWQRLTDIKPRTVYDRCHPAVAMGDAVYLCSSTDDQVRCIDAATGALCWQFFADGPIRFAPTIADGRLFFGSDDGSVYCLDSSAGRLLWRVQIAPTNRVIPGNGRLISAWPVRTGVAVDHGTVFVTAGLFPAQGTWAMALEAATGREVWKTQLPDLSPQGYLLVSSTKVYVPNGRNTPFALARDDGRFLGKFGGPGGAYALLVEGELLSGGGNKGELALATSDSRDQIASFAGNRMIVTPALSYLQTDTTLSALDRSRYVELTQKRKVLKARQKSLGKQFSKLVAAKNPARKRVEKDMLTIGKRIKTIDSDLANCVLWRKASRHPHALVLAGTTLFAGGEDEVAAYSAKTGKQLWRAPVDGMALALAVANGRLLVSTDSGTLHAFGRDHALTTNSAKTSSQQSSATTQERFDFLADLHLPTKGHALVLACDTGDLLRTLAQKTDLQITGLVPDPGRLEALRRELSAEGIYGTRIDLRQSTETLPFTDWFANLVVVEGELPVWSDEFYRVLRPYGGLLIASSNDTERLNAWQPQGRETLRTTHAELHLAITRRKALPGAGEWTHSFGNAQNTSCSEDTLVRGQFGLQWFGGPGPSPMIDRHLRTAPPLWKDGRLLIPGHDLLICVDAYNGTVLWETPIAGASRMAVPFDSGYMAADSEGFYIAAHGTCYVLDPASGAVRHEFAVPKTSGQKRDWGYLANVNDRLVGTTQQTTASRRVQSRKEVEVQYRPKQPLVTSDSLFAIDPRTGKLAWRYRGGTLINSSIVVTSGTIYFVESHVTAAAKDTDGRVDLTAMLVDADLVGVDLDTGAEHWRTSFDKKPFAHSLYLSSAHNTLVAAGADDQAGQTTYHLFAWDLPSKKPLWNAEHADSLRGTRGSHGEQVHHPVIRGTTLLAEPTAYDLRTGKRIDPTGGNGMQLHHRRACGTFSASAECLFYRDDTPTIVDLIPGGTTRKLTKVSRPGCWISILPAGGLVLLPEASSGCVCSYPIQTSMAFISLEKR